MVSAFRAQVMEIRIEDEYPVPDEASGADGYALFGVYLGIVRDRRSIADLDARFPAPRLETHHAITEDGGKPVADGDI
jgi:hypothetical protein